MANSIKGTIYDTFNAPISGAIVQAFDRDLRIEELLGQARTDAQGKYAITYKKESFEGSEKKSADIFLRIAIRLNDNVQQEIAKSPIHFNVPEDYVLDFKIDGTPNVGPSEFDTLPAAITPLLTRQHGWLSKNRQTQTLDGNSEKIISIGTWGLTRAKVQMKTLNNSNITYDIEVIGP